MSQATGHNRQPDPYQKSRHRQQNVTTKQVSTKHYITRN
uniref:Uncharacterized protein n=1 Tax=Anguilla anguilla TaxID=7936 RepID=A0A0E9UHL6_ANGAN